MPDGMRGWWLGALLLAVAPVTPASAQNTELEAQLQNRLETMVAEAGIPGATLGVVLSDGRTLALAAGVADTTTGAALRPDDRMLQGSVGKTYFAAVALQLVEEGRLELDRPIGEYFPEAAWVHRIPNGPDITLRHLMGHTSGLVRYEFNPAFFADLHADPLRTFTPEERLSYLFDQEAAFAPGEGWDYSDTNYIVVAMLIERATGRSAYEEIQHRFLTPLGLDETVPSNEPRVPGLVQGYAGADNPFGPFDEMLRDGELLINPQFEWGGGGIASSAVDLARWMHHLQSASGFEPSLLEQIRDGHPAPLGPEAEYGLGVIMMTLKAGTAWGHSGFMPGYRTEAYHFPEHGFTVALQFNSSDSAALRTSPLRALAELAELLADRH